MGRFGANCRCCAAYRFVPQVAVSPDCEDEDDEQQQQQQQQQGAAVAQQPDNALAMGDLHARADALSNGPPAHQQDPLGQVQAALHDLSLFADRGSSGAKAAARGPRGVPQWSMLAGMRHLRRLSIHCLGVRTHAHPIAVVAVACCTQLTRLEMPGARRGPAAAGWRGRGGSTVAGRRGQHGEGSAGSRAAGQGGQQGQQGSGAARAAGAVRVAGQWGSSEAAKQGGRKTRQRSRAAAQQSSSTL